jgi:hypothetical protein
MTYGQGSCTQESSHAHDFPFEHALGNGSSVMDCSIALCPAGASFGQWKMPWSPEERLDSLEIIDWITQQAWSNGQVSSFDCYDHSQS